MQTAKVRRTTNKNDFKKVMAMKKTFIVTQIQQHNCYKTTRMYLEASLTGPAPVLSVHQSQKGVHRTRN